MLKKFFVVFLIFVILFTSNLLSYFEAKADTLVLTATSLSFISGFGEVLLAAALVGVAGYMTYKTISSIMARRMTAAYISMTDTEKSNLDTFVSSWDGTSDVTLSYDQVRSMGGEKILNALVSESQSYTPQTYTSIVSLPEINIGNRGTWGVNVPVDTYMFDQTNNVKDAVEIISNNDIKLQVYIEYHTYGIDYQSGTRIYFWKHYETQGEMGLGTKIIYKILDYRTGIQYQKVFSIVTGAFVSDIFGDLAYGNSIAFNYNVEYGQSNSDYKPTHTGFISIQSMADILATDINDALGVSNLFTGQDVFPTIPFVGDGSIEYSPPLVDVTSVSLPQSITLTADPGVYYNDRDVIPLIPPAILDSNPDIKTALETGTNTATMTNVLTIDTPTTGTGTVLDAIQSVLDAINRFFDFSKPIDLNPLMLSGNLITTKFPFCLPWDLKNAILKFNGTGERPDFNISINNKLLGNQDISIDISMFEPIIDKVKIIETILFTLGLVMLTPKLIGGDR